MQFYRTGYYHYTSEIFDIYLALPSNIKYQLLVSGTKGRREKKDLVAL